MVQKRRVLRHELGPPRASGKYDTAPVSREATAKNLSSSAETCHLREKPTVSLRETWHLRRNANVSPICPSSVHSPTGPARTFVLNLRPQHRIAEQLRLGQRASS